MRAVGGSLVTADVAAAAVTDSLFVEFSATDPTVTKLQLGSIQLL